MSKNRETYLFSGLLKLVGSGFHLEFSGTKDVLFVSVLFQLLHINLVSIKITKMPEAKRCRFDKARVWCTRQVCSGEILLTAVSCYVLKRSASPMMKSIRLFSDMVSENSMHLSKLRGTNWMSSALSWNLKVFFLEWISCYCILAWLQSVYFI